jgi:hypothetical protein
MLIDLALPDHTENLMDYGILEQSEGCTFFFTLPGASTVL